MNRFGPRFLLTPSLSDGQLPLTAAVTRQKDDEVPSGVVSQDVEVGAKKRVLSHNEKYRAVFTVCQRIAEGVTDKVKRGFEMWRDRLMELERVVREDKHPPVAPLSNDAATSIDSSRSESVGRINEIGEMTTGENGADITKTPNVTAPDGGGTVRSVSSAELVSVAENVLGERKSKKKPATGQLAKRKLEMDDTQGEKAPPNVPSTESRKLVELNPASRTSGRPKQKEKFKNAKKSREIKDTMAFVDTVANIGDVTLESCDELLKTKVLSIVEIGDTLGGIRRMFDSAVFKRPKTYVVASNPTQFIETNIGFVLPGNVFEVVHLSMPLITLVVWCDIHHCVCGIGGIATKRHQNTLLIRTNTLDRSFGAQMLRVCSKREGTRTVNQRYEAVNPRNCCLDIERRDIQYGGYRADENMARSLENLSKALQLIKFVERAAIEDDQEEERRRILRTIPHMGVDSVFRAAGHDVPFKELVGYGGDQWLNDTWLPSVLLRRPGSLLGGNLPN